MVSRIVFLTRGAFGRMAAMIKYMDTMPSTFTTELSTFANPAAARDYTIRMTLPEFTCLCPMTGQPDFATLELEYVPDQRCVELKSLKLYLWSFRDRGSFHEAVTNEIADHIAAAIAPRFLRLTAKFNVRGGIYTTVVVESRLPGWVPGPAVALP
ncbi:MAG: preQ(1) synthase [Steroidobacteraceae bacterium]